MTDRGKNERGHRILWIALASVGAVIFVTVFAVVYFIENLSSKIKPADRKEQISPAKKPAQSKVIVIKREPPKVREVKKNSEKKSEKKESYPPPPKPKYKFVLRGNVYPPPSPHAKPPPPLTSSFYAIKREEFKRWADLPLEEMGVRYKPFFLWGHYRGMLISDMEETSFLRRLGLYPNDIIVSVNGKKVVSPGYAKKIYQEIARKYRTLTIQFIRGGKTYTLDFSLR